MTTPTYQPGDIVDVALTGVQVVTVHDDNAITLQAKDLDIDIYPDAPAVTVTPHRDGDGVEAAIEAGIVAAEAMHASKPYRPDQYRTYAAVAVRAAAVHLDAGRAGEGRLRALIADLVSGEECWFDHHGGCQEHGYLSLEPGQKCPHQEAKEILAENGAAQ